LERKPVGSDVTDLHPVLDFYPKIFNKRLSEICPSVWSSKFLDNCAIPIIVRKAFKWVIAYRNEK
jgi:hypothetical protein